MQRLFLMGLMFFLLLLVGPAAGASPDAARLHVVQSDAAGVRAVLSVPPPLLTAEGVTVAGLQNSPAARNRPPLPIEPLLVALPPGASAVVRVTPGMVVTRTVGLLASVVLPAAAPPADTSGDATPTGWHSVSDVLTLRGYRFVQVNLYPARYEAASQMLTWTDVLSVTVAFAGGEAVQPGSAGADDVENAVLQQAINGAQAAGWRAAAAEALPVASLPLPTDRDVYHFGIEADGLYKLDEAALRAAGLPVDRLDPRRLRLMQGGNAVAYEWLGDDDARFEAGEALRFFAWAFDGTREERQHVRHNRFWLWVGDTADVARVPTVANPNGYPPAAGYRARVTFEPERFWHPGWTADWGSFPNAPDAWYWHYFARRGAPVSATFALTLTQPLANAPAATVEAELMGRRAADHFVQAMLNASQPAGLRSWSGFTNVNLAADVPAGSLRDGVNQLQLTVNSPADDDVLLNRISVAYWRRFAAQNGVLHFVHDVEGQVEFRASGLPTGNAADVLVWRVDQRAGAHYRIGIAATDMSGSGPYSARVASYHEAGTEFLVTTAADVRTPSPLARYRPAAIWPPGGVDWIAVAYSEFVPEAQRLAAYRATASGLRTAVVDVNDVIQQVGFGLPLPQAIRLYLAQLAAHPQRPLRYAVLVGDATLNPRGLPCTGGPGTCYSGWNGDEPAYVPTDLPFVDRFIGQIPSDHLYMAVSGADIGPDIAVGRLTVGSVAQLRAVIDKTIVFENGLRNGAAWMRNLLFVSDDTDSGGDFCRQNAASASHVPGGLTARALCLRANPTPQDEAAFRATILAALADPGALVVNYRGHGSLTGWGEGDRIMSRDDAPAWANAGRPAVVISADCLDGNFAWPGRPAFSETLLRTPGGGSAAHWSSTGLGYSFEHTVLNEGLYSALFDHALTTIGDAVVFAKWAYVASGHDRSQLYAFTLQGDPALALAPPDLAVTQSVTPLPQQIGQHGTAQVTLRNNGILPTAAELSYRLPQGFTLSNVTLQPTGGTIEPQPDGVRVMLNTPLIAGATVSMQARVTRVDAATYEAAPYAVASARALRGRDLPGNNEALVTLPGWAALAVAVRESGVTEASRALWWPFVLGASTAIIGWQRRRTPRGV